MCLLCGWLLPAMAAEVPAADTAPARVQKSPELRYLDGLACLKKSDVPCAQVALAGINPALAYAKLLEAQIAADAQDYDSVLRLLIPLQAESGLLPQAQASLHATLALAYAAQDNPLRALEQRCLAEPYLENPQAISEFQEATWQLLAQQARDALLDMRGESSNSTIQGWVDLALALQDSANGDAAVAQWRQAYPDHPAEDALLQRIARSPATGKATATAEALQGKVAVLLPLDEPALAAAAEALQAGLMAAQAGDGADMEIYATGADQERALAAYQQALEEGARYVIGPMTRDEVNALAGSGLATVPTLALNQPETGSSPNLAWLGRPLEAESRQIAEIARQLGMQSALVVYAESPLGERMASTFAAAWTESGGSMTHKAGFSPDTDLAALRSAANTRPADMIFLAANAEQARLVRPYLDQATPTFGTSHIFDGDAGSPLNQTLNAVHFIDMPWLLEPRNPAFAALRPAAGSLPAGEAQRWFALGVDAWHILSAMAAHTRPAISGLSGNITWRDGQPQRSLTKAQFRNGGVSVEALP